MMNSLMAMAAAAGLLAQVVNAGSEGSRDASLRFRGDGKFKIVQFTDIHWLQNADKDQKIRQKILADMDAVLEAEHPDLVVLTGDIVTPTSGESPLPQWTKVTAPMATRHIPWAAVFGNHDDEWNRTFSRKDIMAYLEKLPESVSQCGPDELGAGGNYVLKIKAAHADKPAAAIYCLDSHAYSTDRKLYGTYGWFSFAQAGWFRQQSKSLTAANGNATLPALAFFHIPLPEFKQASVVSLGNQREESHGASLNPGMFTAMVESRDVIGIFVGHDHINDFAGRAFGICLGYGRKTGVDFAAYGKFLPSGARVIELQEGKPAFETWIRTGDNKVESRILYPDGFDALEKQAAATAKKP